MLRITEFGGTNLSAAKTKLPKGAFQIDLGGDRYAMGAWKQRRGNAHTAIAKVAAPVTSLIGFEKSAGDYGTVLVEGTTARSATGSLGVGLNGVHRFTAAEYRRRAYLTNGWDPVYRWDGYTAALELAGIAGPSEAAASWTGTIATAAGTSSTPGIHLFRYRYMDSRTGYVSNPSLEIEKTIVAGALGLTFTVENAVGGAVVGEIQMSADSKVDTIILEATIKDSTGFYEAARVPNDGTDIVFDVGDAALEQAIYPWPDLGHLPPPQAKHVLSYGERLWLYGEVRHTTGNCTVSASVDVVEGASAPAWSEDALGAAAGEADADWQFLRDGDTVSYPISYADNGNNKLVLDYAYVGTGTNVGYTIFSRTNRIYVSEPGYPEGFRPLTFVEGPNGELAGDITAVAGFGGALVIFSLSGMSRFIWELEPTEDGILRTISSKYGALSPRVVVVVDDTLYTMDRLGWHSYGGVRAKHISRPIDDLLDDMDFTLSDQFHGVYIPELRAIRWFYCETGDVYPKKYAQFDVDTGAWSTGEYEVEIAESRLVPTANGPRILLGDENGHVWQGDTGTVDGGDADNSHLSVGPSATTTSIPTTAAAIPTANSGLAGAMAYHVESGESRLVASNTATTLTTAAFTSAPEEGDTIHVGRVKAKLRTQALSAPRAGPRHVARPLYLWLLCEPNANTRYARVRFYEDGSTTAKSNWGEKTNRPDDETALGAVFPGKHVQQGTSDWKVDLSKGLLRVPCGETYNRTLEAEIEFLEPDSVIELYGIEWEAPDEGELLE